jgi:hypothetical protein
MSRHGGVGFTVSHGGQSSESWSYRTHPPDFQVPIEYATVLGFIEYQALSNQTQWVLRVRVPWWSLIVFFFAIAPIPWLPCRFSLRTLLIGMTLIAVVLGLLIWAAN